MAKSRTAKSNLFRSFEQSNQPIYLMDSDRNIIFCNQALADWVSESVEVVTTWQCNYQSNKSNDSKASQLCPTISGSQENPFSCFVSRGLGTGTLEFRRATCQALEFDDEKPALLVILDNERTSPHQVAAGANHDSDRRDSNSSDGDSIRYHDLLKQVRDEILANVGFEPILGVSPVSQRLRRQVSSLMNSNGDILIVGPQGSGRQTIAEIIHYGEGDNQSPSSKQESIVPLVPIKSSLCDPEMIQSTIREVFASKSGEVSSRMLILEADLLSQPSQIELREFFQIPDFKLSVIATSSSSLMDLAANGEFDEGLALRLSTFMIEIPPLSERAVDIPLLVQALVENSNAGGGRQLGGANRSAMQVLSDYHWPGEYVELKETIINSCKKATGPNIVKDDLPKRLLLAESARKYESQEVDVIDLPEYLTAIETELIRRAVAQSKGNKSRAAKMLGLSRASLLRRWVQIEGGE